MILEFQNIEKRFGDKEVLKGVSFCAESGRACGLLGRNGAGKTTTIRILLGLFPADGGQVLLDGRPIDRKRIRMGYLPEERGLYPKKQVLEQMVYFGALRGLSPADAKRAALRWLDRLEMREYADKKLDTLSKGNQQKIQLAVAVLCDPDIVVLDEPFSGLDPVNALLLKDVVRELIEKGKIVLFSSHQMAYTEEFCHDIAILHRGEIVLQGGLREIKRSYDRRVVLVNGPDLSGMADALRGLAVLRDCAVTDAGLRLTLEEAEGRGQVLQALLARGYAPDDFHVYEPTLNDIFVEYTGDDQ